MEARQIGCKEMLLQAAAWLGSSALLVVNALTARGAFIYAAQRLAANAAAAQRQQGRLVGVSHYGWTVEAVDRGVLLVLACVGVALAVLLEYYYRTGLQKGQFRRRVAKVTAIQVAAILACLGLQELLAF